MYLLEKKDNIYFPYTNDSLYPFLSTLLSKHVQFQGQVWVFGSFTGPRRICFKNIQLNLQVSITMPVTMWWLLWDKNQNVNLEFDLASFNSE